MTDNVYIFSNFKIVTEIIIKESDLLSIKHFNEWYDLLNEKYFYYYSKEKYYNMELSKIINIQRNIISEIYFILLNYGKFKINILDYNFINIK